MTAREKADKERELFIALMMQLNSKIGDVDMQFPSDHYSVYDAEIQNETLGGLAEIKVRAYPSTAIAKMGGTVLERKKYDGIMSKVKGAKEFYYFNFFTDVCKVYKVTADKAYQWCTKNFQKNDDGNAPVISKQVTMLTDEDCVLSAFLMPTYRIRAKEYVKADKALSIVENKVAKLEQYLQKERAFLRKVSAGFKGTTVI